jgi:hypothetical protein
VEMHEYISDMHSILSDDDDDEYAKVIGQEFLNLYVKSRYTNLGYL